MHGLFFRISSIALMVGLGLLMMGASLSDAEVPNPSVTLRALEKSLEWMADNPPDPTAGIGEKGMDIWTWHLYSRLHPDSEDQFRARQETRLRLSKLKPIIEPDMSALSWWAVLFRVLDDQGQDLVPYKISLSAVDLEGILRNGSPTTALWISELLSYSGVSIESDFSTTYVATRGRGGAEERNKVQGQRRGSRGSAMVRNAVALYHEIAPASDLGRSKVRGFSEEELRVASSLLPDFLGACQAVGDTDAAGEVLVVAAILGQKEKAFYREGIAWLIKQQLPNGTYVRSSGGVGTPSLHNLRHGVLVVSWALLESLH